MTPRLSSAVRQYNRPSPRLKLPGQLASVPRLTDPSFPIPEPLPHIHPPPKSANMAPPRPRWEGNKKVAPVKAQKLQKTKVIVEAPVSPITVELQQLLLNIFKNSFAERFADDITPLLQEVKGHLYNRDFATAFGKKEYLETYAARWSASRALGYIDLFWDLRRKLWPGDRGALVEISESTGSPGSAGSEGGDVVCLGGGAGAELVALAGLQKLLKDDGTTPTASCNVVIADIADWTSVVDQLTKSGTQAPPLSKYASAAVRAANIPLVDVASFNVSFRQDDILSTDASILASMTKNARLVTLMFTLNELYSTSVSSTQGFLLNLTSSLSKGAILLVVDSPGSYSSITLNGAEKKYPMQWLMDHTLLNQAADNVKDKDRQPDQWEKIHEDESRWFRLMPTLQYPIELENMRMQVHIYRRL
jgi:25S rRNA (uracil2843-N3)-methyltransferase